MHHSKFAILILAGLISLSLFADETQTELSGNLQNQTEQNQAPEKASPLELEGARVEVYKSVGDVKLNIYIFEPKDHERNESRAAIVFFFGGGWKDGSPQQFEHQCRYLATRGMIAMTADYRVSSRHQTKADACVMDGKSAVRWIRKNATRLGVNPNAVVAAGGSAGGHVAACTATIRDVEQPGDELTVSSKPNALALFNPALVLSSVEGEQVVPEEKLVDLHERMGMEPRKLSPFHQLEVGLPPTIIFHGKSDPVVLYRSVEIFADRANANGDIAKLVGYENEAHGFFNFGRNDNKAYRATLKSLDMFLVDLGFLQGPTPKEIL